MSIRFVFDGQDTWAETVAGERIGRYDYNDDRHHTKSFRARFGDRWEGFASELEARQWLTEKLEAVELLP